MGLLPSCVAWAIACLYTCHPCPTPGLIHPGDLAKAQAWLCLQGPPFNPASMVSGCGWVRVEASTRPYPRPRGAEAELRGCRGEAQSPDPLTVCFALWVPPLFTLQPSGRECRHSSGPSCPGQALTVSAHRGPSLEGLGCRPAALGAHGRVGPGPQGAEGHSLWWGLGAGVKPPDLGSPLSPHPSCRKVKVKSLNCVPLFVTPWTVVCQAP